MNLLIPMIDVPYKVNTNNKDYLFEICLLTKSISEKELSAWLDWHFNKINVDHIAIYDNESPIDILSVIKPYGNRITYTLVTGKPHQAEIYTKHVTEISHAQYVLPIDDDEFIYCSFNLQNYLKRMKPAKLAVGSLLFVPPQEMEKPDGRTLIETNTAIVQAPIRENKEVKTIVNTSYSHYYYDVKKYEDAHPSPLYENCAEYDIWQISDDTDDYEVVRGQKNQFNVIGNVHNPLTYTKNGYMIHAQDMFMRNVIGYLADHTNVVCELFIAHMKIRSKEEWDWKCSTRKVVADMKPDYYDIQYCVYDEIYKDHAYELRSCDLLQKL